MGPDPWQGVVSSDPKQCEPVKRDESGVEEEPEAETESWSRIRKLGIRKANTFVDFIVYVAFCHVRRMRGRHAETRRGIRDLKRGQLDIGRMCL